MCGHCRTLVAGAFIVGGLIGCVASSFIFNAKYRKWYEEEVESTRAAGRRVVKNLKERLAKYERDYPYDEEVEEETDEELYSRKIEEYSREENLETKSAKIPEGKIEEQTCLVGDKEVVRLSDLPQTKNRYLDFCKDTSTWTDGDGNLMVEDVVLELLGISVVKGVYEYASHFVQSEMETMHAFDQKSKILWHIDIYPFESGRMLEDENDGT